MTQEDILQQLKFDMELRGLSVHTQEEYLIKAKVYQNHFGKPSSELGIKEIREFLHYLKTEKKLSNGSINTYNSGLRFLYGVTLDVELNYKQIPCQKKKRNIPDILTQEEVKRLFDLCDNATGRQVLMWQRYGRAEARPSIRQRTPQRPLPIPSHPVYPTFQIRQRRSYIPPNNIENRMAGKRIYFLDRNHH